MPDKKPEIATEQKTMTRSEPLAVSPARMIEEFADRMDRLFEEIGFGRARLGPRLGFGLARPLSTSVETWLPDVEMLQRNNDLVIRADLPGLKKEDIKIEITEDAVILQGERARHSEEEKAGIYRCERSYGSFYRRLPLPEGAIGDRAAATFKDGVLEITMPAPPEWTKRGRRVEIIEPPSTPK
jgi:HSP20 family protein